ncbi:hypothetical protein SAMN02927921_03540 [Sinomicrobium oceani]|uniref:Uncharacterized protein n=1 Tax=Sinomicrobium oceani TaxID=1150368 RepID=A0A1K1RHI3_9FLAO|nr:hypothetical protein SAMN02927921_03540 [Sinomicrobium oceani]
MNATVFFMTTCYVLCLKGDAAHATRLLTGHLPEVVLFYNDLKGLCPLVRLALHQVNTGKTW